MQEGKQIEGLKLVSSQFRKQRLAVWAAGRGWDLSFTAWCFGPVRESFDRSCAGGSKRTQASWKLAVQEGKQIESSKLVSSQFRKQRLAVWAAGRGPDPSVPAMVFWPCERVL